MISVIIPIYNVKKYLSKCIDSVLAQTEKDLEIILVNDGSTDGCGDICKQYEKLDERIVYIDKENGGLSDARNAGIKVARGEYLVFIDSDDYIHPQMLELLLHNLRKADADISVCKFKEILEDDVITQTTLDVSQVSCVQLEGEDVCRQLFDNNLVTVVAWNKLYKKSLFDNVEYPVGVLHEDEYVIHHLLFKASKTVYSDAEMYYYIKRKGSITNRISARNIMDGWNSIQERKEFWLKNKQYQWYNYTLEQELFFIVTRYDKIVEVIRDRKIIRSFRKRFRENMKNEQVQSLIENRGYLFLFRLFARHPFFYSFYLNSEENISLCKRKIKLIFRRH